MCWQVRKQANPRSKKLRPNEWARAKKEATQRSKGSQHSSIHDYRVNWAIARSVDTLLFIKRSQKLIIAIQKRIHNRGVKQNTVKYSARFCWGFFLSFHLGSFVTHKRFHPNRPTSRILRMVSRLCLLLLLHWQMPVSKAQTFLWQRRLSLKWNRCWYD